MAAAVASSSPSSMLKLNRHSNSVRVENIAEGFGRREIVGLFSTLVGNIRGCRELKTASGTIFEISFFGRDATQKALCMSGYTVSGLPLTVTLSPNVGSTSSTTAKRPDDRRNLYVLGLPFTLSKAEFAALFSKYGTVSHCVILATVDNASRRRGFVVMSTHEEAKLAMTSLTRTQMKGHTLDVSWAVVQRSQGFLDGGDRNLIVDSQAVPEKHQEVAFDVPKAPSDMSARNSLSDTSSFPLLPTLLPTNALLIANLPLILFSQVADLEPLLCPFGRIKKMEIFQSGTGPTESSVANGSGTVEMSSTSVFVEYDLVASAREAKEYLQGQQYAGCLITAQFVGHTISREPENITAYGADHAVLSCESGPGNPASVYAHKSEWYPGLGGLSVPHTGSARSTPFSPACDKSPLFAGNPSYAATFPPGSAMGWSRSSSLDSRYVDDILTGPG